MLNFPDTPTLNQIFTDSSTNLSWKWDTVKWVVTGTTFIAGGTAGQIQYNSGSGGFLGADWTTSPGIIIANNATSNWIDHNSIGVAPPSYTTRSPGTKIILYRGLGSTSADYALGISSGTLWSSVPGNTAQFQWFAGTNSLLTLNGAGNAYFTGMVYTGAGLRIGSVNVGGNTWAQLNSLFLLGNNAASAFAWNYSNGGGELNLFINKNGGGNGGLTIYDFPNTSGAITPLLSISGTGYLTVSSGITAGANILCGGGGGYQWNGTDLYIYNSGSGNLSIRTGSGGSDSYFTFYANGGFQSGNIFCPNVYLGNYLFFANNQNVNSGPLLYADTTNMVARMGTGNGGFYVENNAGTNMIVLTAGGNIQQAGVYHGFVNAPLTLANGGGPLIYGDGNWIVAKIGSGNLGFMLYDYSGQMRSQMRCDGTILATGIGANFGQFHMSSTSGSGGIGSMWYNDGGTTYLLFTDNNNALGGFNGLRPFYVNGTSGNVVMGNSVIIGGSLTVGNNDLLLAAPSGGYITRPSSTDRVITFCIAGGGQLGAIHMYTGGLWCHGCNIILENNYWYYGEDTGGNPQVGLGLMSDNQWYIADQSHNVRIRGATIFFDTPNTTQCSQGMRSSGSNSGFVFQNRDAQNQNFDWQWYSVGGIARLWSSADGDRMSLDRGGSLTTVGHMYCVYMYAYGFANRSDIRDKLDIEELPSCLNFVQRLNPKRFKFTNTPDKDVTHWGFIAQDVAEVLGSGRDFGGHHIDKNGDQFIRNDELTAVLWKAFQELTERVAQLEARLT